VVGLDSMILLPQEWRGGAGTEMQAGEGVRLVREECGGALDPGRLKHVTLCSAWVNFLLAEVPVLNRSLEQIT
jgi:hypothetical protein